MEGIKILDSLCPWPTTLIVGHVHWDEVVWTHIINHFETIVSKNHFKWKFIVLHANINATNVNKRFIDIDLNRSFGEDLDESLCEVKRAKEIKSFFTDNNIKVNYVFDFHSTPTKSDPMLICTNNENSLILAKKFNINKLILWLIDIIKGKSLTKYFSESWAIDIAFECWSHNDPSTLEKWKEFIETIFSIHNWVQTPDFLDKTIIKITDIIFDNDVRFVFTKDYKWFELIKSWEVWWKNTKKNFFFDKDKIIVIPNTDYKKHLESTWTAHIAYFGEEIIL